LDIQIKDYKIGDEGYFYAASLLPFLIPFNQFVTYYALALWLVLSIKIFIRTTLYTNCLLLLPEFLYVLYVNLLYPKNEAFHIFEMKSVLVIIPLIFFLNKYYPVYGYGVALEKLNVEYELQNYFRSLKRSLNAYNGYFQLWIELRMFRVTVFLTILFNSWTKNLENSWILPFLTIFTINACFESYLNRYSGLSSMSLFYCFNISNGNSKNLSFEN